MGSQTLPPLLLVPPELEDVPPELEVDVFPELVVEEEDEEELEVEVPELFPPLELEVLFPPVSPKGRLSSLPSAQLVSTAKGSATTRDNRNTRDNLRAMI